MTAQDYVIIIGAVLGPISAMFGMWLRAQSAANVLRAALADDVKAIRLTGEETARRLGIVEAALLAHGVPLPNPSNGRASTEPPEPRHSLPSVPVQ
jgi:hypothetical protein